MVHARRVGILKLFHLLILCTVAGHIRVLDDAIQAVKYKSEQSFDVD
jgi:hypothetical protein